MTSPSRADQDRPTVIVADDHSLVRRGTRQILEESGAVEVIGEAASGVELIDLVEKSPPDVALVDIRMPEMNGIDATEEIVRRWPRVSVLVLTVSDDDEYVWRAVQAGASGYLTKDVDDLELVAAVLQVASGGTALGPSATRVLMNRLRTQDGAPVRSTDDLTDREIEVLKQLGMGLSNKAIAAHLGLSARTVEAHLYNIFKKTGATSRTDAAIRAARAGLISIGGNDG